MLVKLNPGGFRQRWKSHGSTPSRLVGRMERTPRCRSPIIQHLPTKLSRRRATIPLPRCVGPLPSACSASSRICSAPPRQLPSRMQDLPRLEFCRRMTSITSRMSCRSMRTRICPRSIGPRKKLHLPGGTYMSSRTATSMYSGSLPFGRR